jgi:hypothetical protein
LRTFIPLLDGERRWDSVYQLLLRWTTEQTEAQCQPLTRFQEVSDGNRPLCPSIDGAPATNAHD